MTGDALWRCSTTLTAECSNGLGLFRTVTTSVTVGGAVVTSAGLPVVSSAVFPVLQSILALESPLTLRTVADVVLIVLLIFVVVLLLLRV